LKSLFTIHVLSAALIILQLLFYIASDMDTTVEQQTPTLYTDALASNDSHDEISATPSVNTQVLVDPLRVQDKPASENHQAST
jgi:hypothetical protein